MHVFKYYLVSITRWIGQNSSNSVVSQWTKISCVTICNNVEFQQSSIYKQQAHQVCNVKFTAGSVSELMHANFEMNNY